MQSIDEIEAICYQAELDRAEAHANQACDDPTPKELYEACDHRDACLRQCRRRGPLYDAPWDSLACGDCVEWDGHL